eukprot:3676585-Pyramimonas_sp.AAC.1
MRRSAKTPRARWDVTANCGRGVEEHFMELGWPGTTYCELPAVPWAVLRSRQSSNAWIFSD